MEGPGGQAPVRQAPRLDQLAHALRETRIDTAASHATVAEGLAEVAAILAEAGIRPGSARAVEPLTRAAVMYVRPSGGHGSWWFADAAAFLAEAGADLDRAGAMRRKV